MVREIIQLAELLQIQPKACYAALTFGLKHCWTYSLRTLADIQDLLEPPENAKSPVIVHIFAFQCPIR